MSQKHPPQHRLKTFQQGSRETYCLSCPILFACPGLKAQNLFQDFSMPRIAYFRESEPCKPQSCQNTHTYAAMGKYTDAHCLLCYEQSTCHCCRFRVVLINAPSLVENKLGDQIPSCNINKNRINLAIVMKREVKSPKDYLHIYCPKSLDIWQTAKDSKLSPKCKPD